MNFNQLKTLTAAMNEFMTVVFEKSKLTSTTLEAHITDWNFPKNLGDSLFIEVEFYKSLLMRKAQLRFEVTPDFDSGEPQVKLAWERFPSFCFTEDAEKKDKLLCIESAVKALAMNNIDLLYTKNTFSEYFSGKDCLEKVIESIDDKLSLIEDFENIYQSKIKTMMQQMNVEFAAKQFQK